MTTTGCPGCPSATRGHAPACPKCIARLPENIRQALATTETRLSAVHADAVSWLADHPRLTDRELQILRLVSEGHKDNAIAHTLGLSVNTIRDHIKRVSRRLGCSGRAHLMATAYTKGYLPAPCEA